MKEMLLAGICDVDAANAFLPAFMERHNARFAVEPFNAKDLYRPLAIHDDLETTMAWRQARTVSASLTLLYNNVIFILEPSELSHLAIRKQVMVSEYPDGRIEIRHQGALLPYRVFDKKRRVKQAAIVDAKHLTAALTMARDMQAQRTPPKRNRRGPSRTALPASIFHVSSASGPAG